MDRHRPDGGARARGHGGRAVPFVRRVAGLVRRDRLDPACLADVLRLGPRRSQARPHRLSRGGRADAAWRTRRSAAVGGNARDRFLFAARLDGLRDPGGAGDRPPGQPAGGAGELRAVCGPHQLPADRGGRSARPCRWRSRRRAAIPPRPAPAGLRTDGDPAPFRLRAGSGDPRRADRGGARHRRGGGHGVGPGPRLPTQPAGGHLQRRHQLSADCDPAVHPRRRHHECVGNLAAPDRVRLRAAGIHTRRACHGVDRRLNVLRRDLRLGRGRRFRAGLDPDPGHEEQRLPEPRGGRGHVLRGNAGRDHPAVDPDDPLRGDGRNLGGAVVRRRHRARAARAASD